MSSERRPTAKHAANTSTLSSTTQYAGKAISYSCRLTDWLTYHSTHFGDDILFQITMSKHWRRVVNMVRLVLNLTGSPHNVTMTRNAGKYSKHSKWTQWREATSVYMSYYSNDCAVIESYTILLSENSSGNIPAYSLPKIRAEIWPNRVQGFFTLANRYVGSMKESILCRLRVVKIWSIWASNCYSRLQSLYSEVSAETTLQTLQAQRYDVEVSIFSRQQYFSSALSTMINNHAVLGGWYRNERDHVNVNLCCYGWFAGGQKVRLVWWTFLLDSNIIQTS